METEQPVENHFDDGIEWPHNELWKPFWYIRNTDILPMHACMSSKLEHFFQVQRSDLIVAKISLIKSIKTLDDFNFYWFVIGPKVWSLLVRRSSAVSGGTVFFSLVQTFRQRIRKCSASPIPSLPNKIYMLVFTSNWHFSSRFYRRKRYVTTVRVWSSRKGGKRWFHSDWDA